jgi:serine protease Do
VLQSDGSLYREYTFNGTEGQRVTITLESSDFDTYLILVGPDEQVVDQNDDVGPDNYNSEITATLPATGTYRVIANSYDSSGRGRFLLTVR